MTTTLMFPLKLFGTVNIIQNANIERKLVEDMCTDCTFPVLPLSASVLNSVEDVFTRSI